VIKKINTILKKAGEEMQKTGFRGLASFDFILKGDEIYFIECNPRTGGATPQMAFQKELLHGLIFTDEFINVTTGKELSKHEPFIPDSNYEGFNLDCGFMIAYASDEVRINILKSGVYKFKKEKLTFFSTVVEDFTTNNDSIFISYIADDGIKLSSTNFIGFLITHFPLLEIKENTYNFTEKSRKFLEYIEYLVIKK
jgi:hypothetical protein